MYQSIVASGLHKFGVQVSGSGVPAVNVSISPMEGVLSLYLNVTDVTLTENQKQKQVLLFKTT